VAATRTLLIVDDDRVLCDLAREALTQERLHVLLAHDVAGATQLLDEHAVDVVVLDEQLPDGRGHELCARVRRDHPQAVIVFVTAFPSYDHAVQALKAGAHDYLSKPFELEQLALAVSRGLTIRDLERTERVFRYGNARSVGDAVVVGDSAAAERLTRLVNLAAPARAPVLITGETGTGKNLIARAIHHQGPRRERPFLSLSCTALPESLVEAELFGWERGAFTGAVGAREGLLEMADGGSFLLDEIGDMPPALQPKLLAVLEENSVRRLGGRSPRRIDPRIIAATNVDLERQVEERRFRAALFYRLDVIRIHVPPLRQRREDLPALCRHLLAKLTGRLDAVVVSETELRRLQGYPWPGNVRELRNVLERSLILHGQELRPSELLGRGGGAAPGPPADDRLATLAELEQAHIARALEVSRGNLARAARALGISLSTLKRRVKARGPRRADGSGDRLKESRPGQIDPAPEGGAPAAPFVHAGLSRAGR